MSGPSDATMVDLHTHLLPGVDDGAADADEAGRAARALREQGIGEAVATPHLQASVTAKPARLAERLEAFDRAWETLTGAVAGTDGEIALHRGAEVRLDDPRSDLSDDRIRLAGSRFVLVEFSHLRMPPYGQDQLRSVRSAGWTPVLAHPERYSGVAQRLETVDGWRQTGAVLQVNAGSLLGRHGREARGAAWWMLERGWVQVLATDYHSRGTPVLTEALEAVDARADGGDRGRVDEIVGLLLRENPARIVADERPLPVPPLPEASDPWGRLWRWLTGG